MIFDTNRMERQKDSEEIQPQEIQANAIGIIGDTSTHFVAMTRLWINDKKFIENAEVLVAGSEFDREHAISLCAKLKGFPLDEIEFILDYDQNINKENNHVISDIVYDSITRAIDNYYSPRAMIASLHVQQVEPLNLPVEETQEITEPSDVEKPVEEKPEETTPREPYSGEF